MIEDFLDFVVRSEAPKGCPSTSLQIEFIAHHFGIPTTTERFISAAPAHHRLASDNRSSRK
jgi:hypothetical protein